MIPVTYRASFSYLLRHPWQTWMSLLGIALGLILLFFNWLKERKDRLVGRLDYSRLAVSLVTAPRDERRCIRSQDGVSIA